MAGGYTHITLAQLAAEEALHRRPGLLHDEARQALQDCLNFLVIGSMGPDYPYLDIADSTSEAWATAMHQPRCLELIRAYVRRIRQMSVGAQARRKCIAWLFGFASHCVTDGVVHPVVNMKVGPYEQNKTEHRRCEMSQDVLIHAKLNIGPIALNQQLSRFVAETTDSSGLRTRLDRDVAGLWTDALNAVFRKGQPRAASLTQFIFPWLDRSSSASGLTPPDPDEWQRAMLRIMRLAESGGRLTPLARHAAVRSGLTYPEKPEEQYVRNLQVPHQDKGMDFELVFDKALGCVVEVWGHLSLSLQGKPSPLDSMVGWSLDTGYADGQQGSCNYMFWN
ncbi:zinc dependent phospholipase C family protein [Candidatus Electronema sp. TJ]|uniref:zinc dependent phospholipase C family protein n=1 Tax=Candidatus Electronema sp. TJ TaxID=3401573 RepID=UPI003AA9AB01